MSLFPFHKNDVMIPIVRFTDNVHEALSLVPEHRAAVQYAVAIMRTDLNINKDTEGEILFQACRFHGQ